MSTDNPMATFVNGVRWVPFIVDFDTQEGVFSFHLYAVDRAHALDRLEELKRTARILGECHAVIPAGGAG